MKKLYLQIIAPCHKTSENTILGVCRPFFGSAQEKFCFQEVFLIRNLMNFHISRTVGRMEMIKPLILTGIFTFLLYFEILNCRSHILGLKQPIFAKTGWKWLKMNENSISAQWIVLIGWLTSHFKQNRYISIAIWNSNTTDFNITPQKAIFSEKLAKRAEYEGKSCISVTAGYHRLVDPYF